MTVNTNIDPNMQKLENEIRQLRTENQRLKNNLDGLKNPLSDDAIDGIAWVTVIMAIVIGVSFWLATMPG